MQAVIEYNKIEKNVNLLQYIFCVIEKKIMLKTWIKVEKSNWLPPIGIKINCIGDKIIIAVNMFILFKL